MAHLLAPQRDRHQLPGHVHEVEGPLGDLAVGLGGEAGGFVHALAHADHVWNRGGAAVSVFGGVGEAKSEATSTGRVNKTLTIKGNNITLVIHSQHAIKSINPSFGG